MEIYDLQTTVGKGTVLKIHTPTGNNIKRHLLGHFLQYKQFKYLGAKITLVPASTLPADPLQLSYKAGDSNIDPRDMVNPILWKHYHGETMLTDVLPNEFVPDYSRQQNEFTGISGGSIGAEYYDQLGQDSNIMDRVYPKSLMDTSFRKAGIQTGFSTFVKPYVYNVVSPVQLLPRSTSSATPEGTANNFMNATPGEYDQYPVYTNGDGFLKGPSVYNWRDGVKFGDPTNGTFVENLTLTTNRLTPLGWLDTLSREGAAKSGDSAMVPNPNEPNGYTFSGDASIGANLPAIHMLYVLMPPAYKTEFFFRLIIKHFYAFRGFRSCFSVQSFGSVGAYQNLPVPPNFYPSTTALSEMVSDLEKDDSTNTVDVENGTLLTMADGAEGEA